MANKLRLPLNGWVGAAVADGGTVRQIIELIWIFNLRGLEIGLGLSIKWMENCWSIDLILSSRIKTNPDQIC